MSDLQCPATFLVVRVGDTPGEGWRREVAELVERLRDRRVAAVYGGRTAQADAVAAGLADGLGLAARRLGALPTSPAEAADGSVAAPTAAVRCRRVLEDLADLHRGETVLVVDDGQVLDRALEPLARRAAGEAPTRPALTPYQLVTLQVDGDGWRLVV
jgi:Histidine phosphatase superfamily (branch 1)